MADERKLDQLRRIFASGDKLALISFVKNSERDPEVFEEVLSLFRSKSARKEEEEEEGEEEDDDDDDDEDDEDEDEEFFWKDTSDHHFPTTTSAQRLSIEASPISPSLMIKPSVIHVQEATSPISSHSIRERFPLGDGFHRSPRNLSFTYHSAIAKKEKAEREAMEAAALLRRSGVFGRMMFVAPFRPPTLTPQHNEQETQADLIDTFVDYQVCGFCHDLISFQKFCPYCNRSPRDPLHNVVKRFNIGRIASPKATTTV